MRIEFLGASRQVTGSRYCLHAGASRLLVDCGLFQERAFLERNWAPCPTPASELSAVALTHAHVDHLGLLPRLVREGFRGPVFATRATAALAEIVLLDAAEIQEEDAAYKKRRHEKEGRRGRFPEQPLYTREDARAALRLLAPRPYGEQFTAAPGIACTFHDAGHILGSASLEVEAEEGALRRRIVFSGDIGQWGKPLVRDPTPPTAADYVVMESTYGDRLHAAAGELGAQLAHVLTAAFARGGCVLIPTFAVERAQELLFVLGELVHAGRLPRVPVFLDSPMAVDVVEVFRRFPDCLDREAWARIEAGADLLHFPGLRLVRSREESKAINAHAGPGVILATSGMCEAGRIKHHLRRRLGDPANTVLFVGYQAEGTLGRQILEGASEVRIHGRNHPVRAARAQLLGLSAHADQAGLRRWLDGLQSPPRGVFLTHGEPQAGAALAERVRAERGWRTVQPAYGEAATLD